MHVALLGAVGDQAGAAPLGYVLLWGDPDNAGGVSAESYPYDMEFLASGTDIRVGGRWGTSTSNSARIATGGLDLSGGYSTAPTSTTGQNGWNFTHASPTYVGIYNGVGAMWIDGSDNQYSCGHTYNASYGYYNVGVVKMDSSQSVDWNVTYKANNSFPYGFETGVVWKSETSGYLGIMGTVYNQRNSSYKKRYQMLGLNDSTGAVTTGKVAKANDDTVTNSQTTGPPYRSNFNGDEFATACGHWTSAGYGQIETMLWTAEALNFQNEWTIGNQSIRSQGNGGNAISAMGVCVDSSSNVYVLSFFGATAIASGYTPYNVGITRYTAAGSYDWTYVLRAQAGGIEDSLIAGGITISADDDDLFISGYCNRIGGSNSAPFIAKLDVSGATPSLTWITQFASASYNGYSSNCKLIGTDTVLSFGYGQTDPTANVLGVLVAANQDGSTLGSGTVDEIAWTAIDLSSYIVFADGASFATANVDIVNQTSSGFTYATGTETAAGATPDAWTNGATTPTIQVESGGIEA